MADVVEELKRSRDDVIGQHNRTLPLKYVDLVHIDPDILSELNRGVWHGIVPIEDEPCQ